MGPGHWTSEHLTPSSEDASARVQQRGFQRGGGVGNEASDCMWVLLFSCFCLIVYLLVFFNIICVVFPWGGGIRRLSQVWGANGSPSTRSASVHVHLVHFIPSQPTPPRHHPPLCSPLDQAHSVMERHTLATLPHPMPSPDPSNHPRSALTSCRCFTFPQHPAHATTHNPSHSAALPAAGSLVTAIVVVLVVLVVNVIIVLASSSSPSSSSERLFTT